MIPSEIIAILTPIVIFLVVQASKYITGKISGVYIVALIVPLLSLAVAYLTDAVANPELSFWGQFGYGLLAVFVKELLKQLQQAVAVIGNTIISIFK